MKASKMKKAWLIIWVILVPWIAFAQWKGSYTMIIEQAQSKEPIIALLNFKGNKIAMEIHFGQEAVRIRTIYDLQNKTITTASEKDGAHKYAMTMKLNPELIEKSTEEIRYTRTDEQRIIDNMICYKTLAETPKDISEMWLTTGVNLSYEQTMGMIPQIKNSPISGYMQGLKPWKDLTGFPLEIISYPKDKPEEKSFIRFKDIRPDVIDRKAFELTGYHFVDASPALH